MSARDSMSKSSAIRNDYGKILDKLMSKESFKIFIYWAKNAEK